MGTPADGPADGEASMTRNARALATSLFCGGASNRRRTSAAILAVGAALAWPTASVADEGGVPFWASGIFGSLAASPLGPGWTVNETYYHWSGWAGADVALAREITIGRFNPTLNLLASGSINANADLVFGSATYVFANPVLGGQASLGMLGAYGRTDANLQARSRKIKRVSMERPASDLHGPNCTCKPQLLTTHLALFGKARTS